ncbi:hypothetical protein GGQ92_001577 [Gracilibacillus halotolerans]|uniref:Uncharacterized protein n=1 Tax=Gracilibacillus halotolerans TaxID=74386 RepID=A0A841RQ61_9BACI|nr:hypothetical protein [Gracilibacillus halotolerans]MBB6512788.1 hypothetical protein [Gracilibacillus halotolerans]
MMFLTWQFYKRHNRKLYSLLLYPYILFFFFILIYGKEVLDVHVNNQIFTVSLAYFAIHSCLSLYLLNRMMDEGKKVSET